MSIVTDWFLSSAEEAEAIASIAMSEEHSFNDWPHLQLWGIAQLELIEFADILVADRSRWSSYNDLLYQAAKDGPFVTAVNPRLVAALTALTEDSVVSTALSWRQSEHLQEMPLAELQETLTEMVAFSRRRAETVWDGAGQETGIRRRAD
jgi:hypothetical protein